MVAVDLCKTSKMQIAAKSQAKKIIKYTKNVPTKTTISPDVIRMCFCIMSLKDLYFFFKLQGWMKLIHWIR